MNTGEVLRLKEIINLIFKGGQGSGNFGHAGRPGEVGGSSINGNVKSLSARELFTRQDRNNIDRVKYRSNDAIERSKKYPTDVIEKLKDIDVIVSSDEFLPDSVKGAGGGYWHNTIYISNNWSKNQGDYTLDHEVGHAYIDKIGPKFAYFWYQNTGTQLGLGDIEEDASDDFSNFISGNNNTVFGKWFMSKNKGIE